MNNDFEPYAEVVLWRSDSNVLDKIQERLKNISADEKESLEDKEKSLNQKTSSNIYYLTEKFSAVDNLNVSHTSITPSLTEDEQTTIKSYHYSMKDFLVTLVEISKLDADLSPHTPEQLEFFRHNMTHLFVNVQSYISGWHPADLRTLRANAWTTHEIIRFMMSQKVKYILCHDDKVIQCLNHNGTVYVFEKKPS